jgi:hypothetical protein
MSCSLKPCRKGIRSNQRQTLTQVQIFLKFSHRHCCSILQLFPLAAASPAAMLGVVANPTTMKLAMRITEVLRAMHQLSSDIWMRSFYQQTTRVSPHDFGGYTGTVKRYAWEATMRPWAKSLLGSLVAATIACTISVPGNSAAAAPARGDAKQDTYHDTYIVLVGASGHDSVGSLLPLPLMPSPRFRATKSWKGKPRPCCAATRATSKNR